VTDTGPQRHRLSDAYAAAAVAVRRRGFWSGWHGVVATIFVCLVIVALLVGWVLLWVYRPEGPSVTLLTLGSVGFGAVLVSLVTLLFGLRRSVRLHDAEAAFLTAVSHHLRTPIAGIRAAAQMVGHPGLDEAQRARLLHSITAETERLNRLVDNVLETGRLEIGRHTLAAEPLDLAEIVDQAVRERAAGAEAKLTAEVVGPLPLVGDPHSLRLLLDNLLDNALKYSGNQPEVTVRAAADHGAALLTVTDRGQGFDATTGARLFTRFRRGDTGGRGWGLGLALTRAIARAHGGDVVLESEGPGRGAVATVRLPLARHVGVR
jgi:signal transduction histidine kinase